jgi:hypothetical protein
MGKELLARVVRQDRVGEERRRKKGPMALNKFTHHATCKCTECIDHPSQAKIGIHVLPNRLYVVTMLENPLRWRKRYENYWAFEQHIEKSGGILYTAEVAFGERHFEITDQDNPRHLQLYTDSDNWNYEIWHKENVLNLLINRLPADAKYIAWIDSDVRFAKPDWCQETMHLLQHYQVLQMFSHTLDLGPEDEPVGNSIGYVYKKITDPDYPSDGYYYGGKKGLWVHPGFAWAARRDALNHLGGLVDWCILGSGDWTMGAALFGEVEKSLNPGYSETYKRWARQWQERAEKYIRRNVGYMPGLVHHRWHGKKMNRNYDTRWRLLIETGYDPELDLKRDVQGLWQLTDRSIALRDGIRRYAKLRNEDGTEV